MGTAIGREFFKKTVTVHTTLGSCSIIDMRGVAGGILILSTGTSITALTYYVAEDPAGTFVALEDGADTPAAIAQVVDVSAAQKAVPIPDECYGAGAIKVVATGGTDAAAIVCLKG